MVNIALHISGRLRFTEDSLNSLVGAIVEPLQPDIFCSFWNTQHETTWQIYSSALSPKLFELEDQQLVLPYLNTIFPFKLYQNLPSMSYKFYRSSMLRQSFTRTTGKQYDIVIQARSDAVFYEKLDINRCMQSVISNQVLSANRHYNNEIDPYVQPRIADNFYLGPTASVDLANTTFLNLQKQAEEYTVAEKWHELRIAEVIESKIWNNLGVGIGSLPGTNLFGDFWYDIDRRETNYV